MFEYLDDAGVVARIEEATRAEAVAGADRLAAIAELARRRVGDSDDPQAWWACDFWDAAAAEVAAAMNIGHRRALGQIRIAEALRDHLPKVAGLHRQGRLSSRVVATITWRTRLIDDDTVWARVDAAIAARAQTWGPLTEDKLDDAVDALVQRHDPAAVIASRAKSRTRDFTVGSYGDDDAGLTSVWGTLHSADAAVVNQRVSAMAAGVCAGDPRSLGERRADALGALANGNQHLACACGSATCPVAADQPPSTSSVVIRVLADQPAIDAATQCHRGGAPTDKPAAPGEAGTAIIPGYGVLPTPMLAELLRNGATVAPLPVPCEEPQSGYRPSARTAEFVRTRDMTCRFPGCHVPAQCCDIDHVIPWPLGRTHPSDLICLCRKHHLLKTFWSGHWTVSLDPDGTATWTAPTGKTYTTHPGSRIFFPDFDTATAALPPPPPTPPSTNDRAMMMPTRKRTRTAERNARIQAERQHNTTDPPF